MKIEIKTKDDETIPTGLAEDIMQVMDKYGYKQGSIKEHRICDHCECELPKNYKENLCPNCEAGKHDVTQEV